MLMTDLGRRQEFIHGTRGLAIKVTTNENGNFSTPGDMLEFFQQHLGLPEFDIGEFRIRENVGIRETHDVVLARARRMLMVGILRSQRQDFENQDLGHIVPLETRQHTSGLWLTMMMVMMMMMMALRIHFHVHFDLSRGNLIVLEFVGFF